MQSRDRPASGQITLHTYYVGDSNINGNFILYINWLIICTSETFSFSLHSLLYIQHTFANDLEDLTFLVQEKFEGASSTNCTHTQLHYFRIVPLQAILSWTQTKNSHRGTNLVCREDGQEIPGTFSQQSAGGSPLISSWTARMLSSVWLDFGHRSFLVTLKLPGPSKHLVLRQCSVPKLCLQTS